MERWSAAIEMTRNFLQTSPVLLIRRPHQTNESLSLQIKQTTYADVRLEISYRKSKSEKSYQELAPDRITNKGFFSPFLGLTSLTNVHF